MFHFVNIQIEVMLEGVGEKQEILLILWEFFTLTYH